MADERVSGAAAEVGSIVDRLRLFDDTFMEMFFKDNIPAMELVLQIILDDKGIKVMKIAVQDETKSPLPNGRSVCFDVTAQDALKRFFDVEVQRSDAGAVPQRARYHAGMLDMRMLKAGEDFKKMLDSYVIFITEHDYFKEEKPLYRINRTIEDLGNRPFNDGSHIVYVNGAYEGSDPIGLLMADFRCTKASEAHFAIIAEGLRHFKEGEGRKQMCKLIEDYAKDYAQKAKIINTVEMGIDFGLSQDDIVSRLMKKFSLTEADAVKYYDLYSNAPAV